MFRRITTVVLFGALVMGAAMVTPLSSSVWAGPESSESKEASSAMDRIVFTNGNETECRIIEETPTTVKVMLYFGGREAGEYTYEKSQIIEIQRGVGKEAGAAARKEGIVEKEEEPEKPVRDDAAQIYLVEFEGTFGSDISETPLNQMFEDVDERFNDLIPGTINGVPAQVVDPAVKDQHIVVIKMDCGTDDRMGFDGIWRFKDLDEHVFEPQFKKGRRIVFWIKEARNGAAMAPWVSPEIYFHPEGRMFFTSDLEDFDIGEDVVDEKQISLRLGQARGFAQDGGYKDLSQIIKAMVRSRYWLYYRLEGGKAEFHHEELEEEEQATGGWILLTDNGKGKNEDKKVRRKYNDMLIIDSELAGQIDLSKGEARTEKDLAHELGVHRNYTIIDNDAERIFEKWVDAKEAAIDRINRQNGSSWIEFQRVKVAGTYTDRTRARGRKKRILEGIYSDFGRFAEVWDSDGSQRSRISTMIEQLKKEQQADKAVQRAAS